MFRQHARLWTALLFIPAIALAQRTPIPQQLTFTPYHSSGIYDIGKTVGWTVTPGPDKPVYAYKWTIRRNNAVILKASWIFPPGRTRSRLRRISRK